MIKIFNRIHYAWKYLMLSCLVICVCHGIEFHRWSLCIEWFVGCCLMLYTEYKYPTKKKVK